MKIYTIFLVSLTFTLIVSKEMGKNEKLESKVEKTKTEVKLPVVDRFPDTIIHASVPNDPYTLQHAAGFINPLVMDKIPMAINNNLNPGIIEEARTFITDKAYYDGSNNLSAIHIDCNIYTTNVPSCVKQSGCGWCGEKNACVSGTANGPLAPCLRSTFLYTMPTPEWTPLKAGTINVLAINQKGQPQNIITPEPNLRKVDVYNPYK